MKHWMLVKGSDGIAVQGHLHDRVGFPEGVEVVTSGIVGWNHKGTELLLETKEQEGLAALRDLLSSGSPASAVQQLLGLIDKVAHNQDVLLKIKNWSALMSGRRS